MTARTPWPQFTREQWHKFPLKLRQRWWRETSFGGSEPSEDLKKVICEELVVQNISKSPQTFEWTEVVLRTPVDPLDPRTHEWTVLAQYSSLGLRKCELDRAGKKEHLARQGIRGSDAELILDKLYPGALTD